MDAQVLEIKIDNNINNRNFQSICDNIILRMGNYIDEVVVDCINVRYISEYNLDLLLEIKKNCSDISLINVHMGVYELLKRYGFDKFLNVHHDYDEFSIKGLKQLGHGNMGKVYEIDDERIIKTYNDKDALAVIESERRNAREAFISGIDSMIVYEVVKLKDTKGYGLILEKAGNINIKKYLKLYPNKKGEFSKKIGEFVRRINEVKANKEVFNRMTDKYKNIIKRETKFFGKKYAENLLNIYNILDNVPHNDCLIHGDMHFKNIMLDEKENMILIDFGEAGYGNNMLEIGRVYSLLYANSVISRDLFGIKKRDKDKVFDEFLEGYFNDIDDKENIYEFLKVYKTVFLPLVIVNYVGSKGKLARIFVKCIFLLRLKADIKKCMTIIEKFDYERYSLKKN